MKISTQTIRNLKGERPITAITAYDAIFGKLAEEAGIDIILIGDSVGTTLLGMPSTVPVTIEHILHHTKAVSKAVTLPLLVADMPFGTAHLDPQTVIQAAMRLMQEGGAEAIKIEGGTDRASVIAKCVLAGIPVMGHIGLQPQQFHTLGGYRKFGRDTHEQETLLGSAIALEKAGVFAIVAEMVTPELTATLCKTVSVPIIAIGCRHPADGQILVCTDLLGLGHGKIPSFVKQYSNLNDTIRNAYANYVSDVLKREYPKQT